MFEEIHLLREWIGAVQMNAPLYPLWGAFIRGFASIGADAITVAKIISLISYFVNALLVFGTLECFAALAVRRAESAAVFDEANYGGLKWVVPGIGAMVYLLTPGFVSAAFAPTPLLFSQVFPFAALYTLATLSRVKALRTFVSRTFLSGIFIAGSVLSGPIGILPLPLVFGVLTIPYLHKRGLVAASLALALSGFALSLALATTLFAHPLADLLQTLGITAHQIPAGFVYPGAILFFVFGILSSVIALVFIATGRVKPVRLRLCFFTYWGVAALFLGIGTIIRTVQGERRPSDRIVRGILDELGSRKIIISDGLFDDLLAVELPSDVTILRLGREEKVPKEILDTIPNDDIRFAADFGSIAFVTDWLKFDPVAPERVLIVSSKIFETAEKNALEPHGWCWRGRAPGEAVTSAKTLKSEWEKAWGEVASELVTKDELSWKMRRLFAVQGMEIAKRLESEGQGMLAMRARELVSSQIDASYSRSADIRRKSDHEKVIASVRSLSELDTLEGSVRAVRILELEERLLPELRHSVAPEVAWLVHVLRGELALKKGEEFHLEARDEYRVAAMDEWSDPKITAPKLLLLDASLRDEESLESDSLAVLRRDRTNRMALAVLGNSLARQGDYERAEAYLRRAVEEGEGAVMIEPLNDLAETLSRLDRAEEALAISERVTAAKPDAWTFQETRASILLRLGRLDEAEATLNEATRLAREAKEADLARNILDIDWARLMKARGDTSTDYRQLVRNIKSRNLTPAHRKLIEEL